MSKTLKLEDQGQDFLTITVEEDGTLSGYSPMFADKRLTLVGIGTLDGVDYFGRKEVLEGEYKLGEDFYIYLKNTGDKDPLPWKAATLKYKVVG